MVNLSDIKKNLTAESGDTLIGEKEASKASVLIPLIQTEQGLSVLFEERSKQLKSQPGDICFPGGRIEAQDASPQHTAVRETSEELGIPIDSVEVIAPLGKFVPSLPLIIYPFVGILKQTDFSVNPAEVESVFTVPLSFLLQTEPEKHFVGLQPQPGADFPYERVAQGREYQWRKRYITELFYHYKERSIWGMTAKILEHFLSVIKSSQ